MTSIGNWVVNLWSTINTTFNKTIRIHNCHKMYPHPMHQVHSWAKLNSSCAPEQMSTEKWWSIEIPSHQWKNTFYRATTSSLNLQCLSPRSHIIPWEGRSGNKIHWTAKPMELIQTMISWLIMCFSASSGNLFFSPQVIMALCPSEWPYSFS